MQFPVNPARSFHDPGSGLDGRARNALRAGVSASAGTVSSGSSKPVLLVVDDEAEALRKIEHELHERYGSDYRVVGEGSAEASLSKLRELVEAGEVVALVLADQWMPGMSGTDFLTRVREVYPTAKRALLIEWGDRSAPKPILQAMALGRIDYYVNKPWGSVDERFHRVISEFLYDWAKDHLPKFEAIRVVGDPRSPRSHELRDLLGRNGVLHTFHSADSREGRKLIAQVGYDSARLPMVVLFDGQVLEDPSNIDIADACGSNPSMEDLSFDLLISGAELSEQAAEQAWLFGATFAYMIHATKLRRAGEKLVVSFTCGNEVTARAVIVATGASYRRLDIPSLEALRGAGVFYGAAVTEAQAMKEQDVYVVGAGNSAGQAAMHLSKYASSVTILARGSSLADSMSDYLIRQIEATENIEVRLNTQVVDGSGEGRLERLVLEDSLSGLTETVPAAGLFVLIGAQPHTEWLPEEIERDEKGFVFTGRDLPSYGRARLPMPMETSIPGVFAVGDVRHGSVKRVASAVGEGSIAIQMVHEYLTSVTQGRSGMSASDSETIPERTRQAALVG